MEWIRISSNKLKIMLSAEDARHYALDCATADYADAVTRAAFREILTDMSEETGFDANEDKIYIQMYPSREGGCELFVTRIGLLLTDEDYGYGKDGEEDEAPQSEEKAVSALAVRLEDFIHLTSLCRRLKRYRTDSELWRENKVWWLLLRHETDAGEARSLGFVREYGSVCDAVSARMLLGERGTRICAENAVERMAEL